MWREKSLTPGRNWTPALQLHSLLLQQMSYPDDWKHTGYDNKFAYKIFLYNTYLALRPPPGGKPGMSSSASVWKTWRNCSPSPCRTISETIADFTNRTFRCPLLNTNQVQNISYRKLATQKHNTSISLYRQTYFLLPLWFTEYHLLPASTRIAF
jgi:hypothetical protein